MAFSRNNRDLHRGDNKNNEVFPFLLSTHPQRIIPPVDVVSRLKMTMSAETFRIGITITSGCLALILNILLAGIILTTRCRYIGKYKWLLFLYTVSAAIYALIQIFIAGVW